METLTPLQRVAVIIIGLVLTALIAFVLLPWLSKQIESRLTPTSTLLPSTLTGAPTPTPAVSAGQTTSPGRDQSRRWLGIVWIKDPHPAC